MTIEGRFEDIVLEKVYVQGYTSYVYFGNHIRPPYKGHKRSYTLNDIKRKRNESS